MKGKRLALAATAAALGVAVTAGPGTSTGQMEATTGVSYGGIKDREPAWLRLDPSRRAIAAMHIEWAVAPARCSNRRPYFSTLFAGYEWQIPITIDEQGRFSKTVVDRYTDADNTRHIERQEVRGTIADGVATGSIGGRATVVRTNGRVVRCSFGPQRWRLVD